MVEYCTMADLREMREELEEKMIIMKSDLEETIDNLRGDVDRLNRELESRS